MTYALKVLPELLNAALLLALWIEPQRFRQMRISVGALVLVIAVLLVIMGNQERVLAWLAGN